MRDHEKTIKVKPDLLAIENGLHRAGFQFICGVDEAGLAAIRKLTVILIVLYLLRVAFRFMSNYLAHKAAWFLVGDLRTKTYDKLQRMHLGFLSAL